MEEKTLRVQWETLPESWTRGQEVRLALEAILAAFQVPGGATALLNTWLSLRILEGPERWPALTWPQPHSGPDCLKEGVGSLL